MNPEVKKIFVLFNELIQNQSDNILLPPCLKLPNSNSRVFLRNKLTNRRPRGRSEGRGRLAGEIRRRNRYVQV